MNINDLIAIVKKKLQNQIALESILVEDKSFLHKNHAGNQAGKFHLKISLVSKELKQMKRIDSDKKIYKILNEELKKYIHSIQILINYFNFININIFYWPIHFICWNRCYSINCIHSFYNFSKNSIVPV